MRRLKLSFIMLVLAAAAVAQTSSQIESDEVKRVGSRLKCQCGCNENLNCNMSAGQCHFCKPARTKIYDMQRSGMTDATIVESFVKEYGEIIRLHDPNSFFWLVPYVLLGLGTVLVVVIVRKLRGSGAVRIRTAVAGGPPIGDDDPDYVRYRDAIEKDTERLD